MPRNNSLSKHDKTALGVGLLIMAALLGLAFVIADRPFLPAKYSVDEQKIQAIAKGMRTVANDPSFQLVGDIYRVLGLADLPIGAAILGFALYLACLLIVASPSRLASAGPLEWAILIGSVVLAAIYLGHYSKDVFVLPVVVLAILKVRSWRGDVIVLIGLVLYATFFRTYWFLVAGIYVVLRLVLRRSRSVLPLLIALLLILGAMAIIFPLVLGVDLDHYRVRVNDNRASIEVGTRIDAPLATGGPIGGFLNSLYVLMNFFVPLDLALRASVLYSVVAIYLTAMWVTTIARANQMLRRSTLDARAGRAFALLISLTAVQSVFEPDYGSYIRHLAPVLLLAVYVVLDGKSKIALETHEQESYS
jgi:hypothetical protein